LCYSESSEAEPSGVGESCGADSVKPLGVVFPSESGEPLIKLQDSYFRPGQEREVSSRVNGSGDHEDFLFTDISASNKERRAALSVQLVKMLGGRYAGERPALGHNKPQLVTEEEFELLGHWWKFSGQVSEAHAKRPVSSILDLFTGKPLPINNHVVFELYKVSEVDGTEVAAEVERDLMLGDFVTILDRGGNPLTHTRQLALIMLRTRGIYEEKFRETYEDEAEFQKELDREVLTSLVRHGTVSL
jgi:hypothetical protein